MEEHQEKYKNKGFQSLRVHKVKGLGHMPQTLHLVHLGLGQNGVFIFFLSVVYFFGMVVYVSLAILYFFQQPPKKVYNYYRRLGGETNREIDFGFDSIVRARGLVVRWEWAQNVVRRRFPFSLFA